MKTNQNLSEIVKNLNSTYTGRKPKLQGIHLPTILLSSSSNKGVLQNKLLKKLSLGDVKKIPLVIQNQDLHLLQLKKIYLESKPPLKRISLWKLPQKHLTEEKIREATAWIRLVPNFFKQHLITWISKAKQEEEKNIQEHLELQKQRKESRNYVTNKPIFQ